MGSFVCFSLNAIIFIICLLIVYREYSITGLIIYLCPQFVVLICVLRTLCVSVCMREVRIRVDFMHHPYPTCKLNLIILSPFYFTKQLTLPFILGRFNQTTCLVYNITYQGKTQCLTDQRKRDYYDCYTILVKHNTNNCTTETGNTAILHSSGVKLVMHNNAEVSK